MKIIIPGGTGFVGQGLTKRWLASNHDIVIVGRDAAKIKTVYGDQVTAMIWDELSTDQLKGVDLIVNLAGAGIAEHRWTEEYKKEILDSRVKTTEKIASLCAKLGKESPPLFNAGGIGIYGMQEPIKRGLPAPLDEHAPIPDPSSSFLVKVGIDWEQAADAAIRAGVRVIKMRFGAVLAKQGGALPKMAAPFELFLGGKMGSGKQPISWITLEDLARAMEFLIKTPQISGPVNMVAPQCVTQKQFSKALGHALGKPSFVPTPGFALKWVLGDMTEELLLSGQHAVPKRLTETGFQFNTPDIGSALQRIYAGGVK